MNAGFEEAKRITRERAKSFYFASHVLGRETRRAAYATYAFCRRCDDAVDDVSAPAEKALALERLSREVDALYGAGPIHEPVLLAFFDVVRSHQIPETAVRGLLEGMRWDLEGRRYRDWDDTLAYCELAAGTVGRMMAALFFARPEVHESAAALGRAMQLTNLVRDVREDLVELDRVYLPEKALERHGVSRQDLEAFARRRALDGKGAAGFRALVTEALTKADDLYREADRGIYGIPSRRARASVVLMRATYREIGCVIEERRGDVFGARATVPLARKLRVSSRALAISKVLAS